MKKMLCVYAIVVYLLCCLTKLELCFGKSTLRVSWSVVLLNKQNSKKLKHNKTYIDSKLCTVPAVVLHWQLYKFHVSLKLLSYVLSLTNICWKNSILRGSHKQRWKKKKLIHAKLKSPISQTSEHSSGLCITWHRCCVFSGTYSHHSSAIIRYFQDIRFKMCTLNSSLKQTVPQVWDLNTDVLFLCCQIFPKNLFQSQVE